MDISWYGNFYIILQMLGILLRILFMNDVTRWMNTFLGITPKMKRMHLHFAKVIDGSKISIFFIISHFKSFGALPIVSTFYDEIQPSACKCSNRVQKIVFHFSKKIRFFSKTQMTRLRKLTYEIKLFYSLNSSFKLVFGKSSCNLVRNRAW